MGVLKKEIDFLIVGQGLAGTSLASALAAQQASFVLVDAPLPGAASRVASGMWNPLTFRLLLKSWRVDDLLPVAMDFYAQAEQLLGMTLQQPLEILRIFPDAAARLRWDERMQQPEFQPYLSNKQLPASPHPQLDLKADHGLVQQAGWLNLPAYLTAMRAHFAAQGAMVEATFDLEDVQFEGDGAVWGDYRAQRIVLCRGQFERHDPWFGWLPAKPAQGDILTLRIPDLKLDQIYNAGFFILPLGGDNYRLGATYEWEQLSTAPTAAGRAELLSKFEAAYQGPYEVLDQQAGIRPTVADRRPLLGAHPAQARLAIFNGLGTKGVMIAPYFALQMADWLLGKGMIEDEVHVKRFRKRYEQQTGSRWNTVDL